MLEAFFLWIYTPRAHADGMADRFIEETLAFEHAQPVEDFQRQLAAFAEHDTLARLGRITAPTLVLAGELDLATPPRLGRVVADSIPAPRARCCPGRPISRSRRCRTCSTAGSTRSGVEWRQGADGPSGLEPAQPFRVAGAGAGGAGLVGTDGVVEAAARAGAGRVVAAVGAGQEAEVRSGRVGADGFGEQGGGGAYGVVLAAEGAAEVPDPGDEIIADQAPQGARAAAYGGAEGGEQRAHVVGDRGAQFGPQGLLVRDGHRPGQRGDGVTGQTATRGSGVIAYVPAARSRRTDWGRTRDTRRSRYQTPLISRAIDQA
ncbi:hypothetical protein SAFG77S_08899 [Streptomyces afghaniensis]